jgi:exodeoxyribonuclease-5
MRKSNGFGDLPQNGDKVICLRNCWDTESSDGNSLVNGTIGYIQNIQFYNAIFPCKRFVLSAPAIQADLISDTEEQDVYRMLTIDEKSVREGVKSFTSQQEYAIMHYAKMEPLTEFNYGYAITCHRAQGSEWGKILVYEEAFPFDREEHARWLYTAVTRAQNRLVLVRK